MTEPTTTNVGLIVPNTGDLVGTWGSAAINPDLSAVDGYLGGVQIISASNSPITLTSPAGFTPTPSGGPTQAQNAVLRFTGTLTAGVLVTLPLPGPVVIENLTTGNFVLQFTGAANGLKVAVDQGEIQTIYNDGTDAKFVNLGDRIGDTAIWAGLSAIPAWVNACSIPPYLLCDGSIYNFSTYPYLGKRLGSAFGGNGITTFGVPDLSGRVALPYDKTGTRITSLFAGINGQTIGAAGGDQNWQLHSHTGSGTTGSENATHTHSLNGGANFVAGSSSVGSGPSSPGAAGPATVISATTGTESASHQHAYSFTTSTSGGGNSGNVQPSQVTGIAVIRAA